MFESAQPDLFPEVPQRVCSEDKDERYTLPGTLEWARQVAGVDTWDLDVAACEEAHVCERYYTAGHNGLLLSWHGRVWCNPPYSDIWAWIEKAWLEMRAGRAEVIAMLIPGNRTDQPGWQVQVEPFRDGRGTGRARLTTHYPPGRQQFGCPGNLLGVGAGSPPFTCVLLVWRR